MKKLAALGVHLFTASGLLTGFLTLLAIQAGHWREAAFWMVCSQVIDGVDGTLARLARVQEVLPRFDGKMIDYVVDFFTYAILPAYFFYESGLAENAFQQWAGVSVILLVSALYYGRDGMVSDDFHFVGFPVMWNVVILYQVYVFDWPGWAHLFLIVLLGILHFAPLHFAYPSRATRYRGLIWAATLGMTISMALIIFQYPVRQPWLNGAAMAAAAVFFLLAALPLIRSSAGKGPH